MEPNEPFLRQVSAVSTPDDNKQMTKEVTIGKLLLQWRSEGRFKGNMLDLDKRMFHDSTHSHYLTMPKGFTEKSLSENSMVCVATGISVKSSMEFCDETLDDLQVRTLIQTIQNEVKSKIWSLELVYCVHDGKKKYSFGHGIVSYGRRYNKLENHPT